MEVGKHHKSNMEPLTVRYHKRKAIIIDNNLWRRRFHKTKISLHEPQVNRLNL